MDMVFAAPARSVVGDDLLEADPWPDEGRWVRATVTTLDAPSAAAAVRRGVVLAAHGADVGAESVVARSTRVGPQDQIRALVPSWRSWRRPVSRCRWSYHPDVLGANPRELAGTGVARDPHPAMTDPLGARVEAARARGVRAGICVDPGRASA